MPARSRTLTYAIAAVVVVAVIIGAAVVYNPFAPNTSNQQTGASSTSSAGQTSQSSTQASSSSIQSGTGALNIYLTDAPPSSETLKYLLVNVSSVELTYQGSLAATTSTTSDSTSSSSSTSTSSTTSSSTTTTATTSTTTSQTSTQPQNTFVFKIPSNVGTNVNLTKLQGQSLLLGATTMPAGNITSVILNVTGAKAFYTDGSSEQLKVVADGKLMIPIHFGVAANGSTDLTFDVTPSLVHISQGGVLTPVIHATAVEKGRSGSTTTHTTDVTETTQTSTTT